MLIGIDASRAFVDKPTGTENYSYNLIKALALIDRKNQYRLYVRDTRYKSLSRDEGLLSRVAQAKGRQETRNWPKNFKFVKISWPRFWTQGGLAAECFLRPPDGLFIPAHTLPIIRRPHLKTVVTIHDLGAEFLPEYHKFWQKFYLTFSTKYAVKDATAVIAVSEATKKDLIEKYGADPAKIFVVYEGVDKEKFRIKNAGFGIKKILQKYKISKPYILFVGTIQPRKNLVRLIEAFSLIVKGLTTNDQRQTTNDQGQTTNAENQALDFSRSTLDKTTDFSPSALSLVITGKFGWLYGEILSAPAKFGVNQQVKFLDYVSDDDLPAIYSQAEVFVMPSLVEGLGLPVLEAMAARVPVVCSAKSSLPEVAGNAALYFNPESVEDISTKIFQILVNSNLKKQLIGQGEKQVEKFSWEATAAETLGIFEKIYQSS